MEQEGPFQDSGQEYYFSQGTKGSAASHGVYVRSATVKGLVEEAPDAYKDVDSVVEATGCAGLAERVV